MAGQGSARGTSGGKKEWTAFVGGIVLAAVAWLAVHGAAWPFGAERLGQASADGDVRIETQDAAPAAPAAPTASAPAKAALARKQSAQNSAASANRPPASSAGAADAPAQAGVAANAAAGPPVRVYLTEEKRIETVPLETYIAGVVAAELPLAFQPAAMEAQAMAARTYIVRRLLNGDRSGVPDGSADVTDTTTHQAYRPLAGMDELKRENEESWRKVQEAVRRTAGDILTYEGQPIEALYFASSNGYTENSEDVFPFKLPYLRSVSSPGDRDIADNWKTTVELSLGDFYKELGAGSAASLARGAARAAIEVLDRSQGHRVLTLKAGSATVTGAEAREKLGLRSAAFDIKTEGRKVIITTYGSGHGVGMSQWGAEAMAEQGSDAEQIVSHYYTGVRIEQASKLAGRLFLSSEDASL